MAIKSTELPCNSRVFCIRLAAVIVLSALHSACTHTYSGYALDGSLSCAERVVSEMGYDVVWYDRPES